MLEINEDIPFLWRLSSDNEQGFSLVSMVIPFHSGSHDHEHTIHTDIVSFNAEQDVEAGETLEWNEEDLSLFLKLLHARHIVHSNESTKTYKVDLSDPDTIEIVHIVAAAGFGMALTVDDLLLHDPGDSLQVPAEPDIGSSITLHTVDGYKRGVVVGHEEDEGVVCVMLDGIRQPSDQRDYLSDIHPHDLVIVKAHHLLAPVYSSVEPQATDTLH
jgi:hypothetical protein